MCTCVYPGPSIWSYIKSIYIYICKLWIVCTAIWVWRKCQPPSNNPRCILLLCLTVACGGSFLLEQPGSSVMGEYWRFVWFTSMLRVARFDFEGMLFPCWIACMPKLHPLKKSYLGNHTAGIDRNEPIELVTYLKTNIIVHSCSFLICGL